MGFLRRLFGPEADADLPRRSPESVVGEDGHARTPDAHPDDVFLPKQKRSGTSLLGGKPPAGWKRQASEATGGGLAPWTSGNSENGHHFGSGGGGGSSGGD